LDEDFFQGWGVDDIFLLLIDFHQAGIAQVVDDAGNAIGLVEKFLHHLIGKERKAIFYDRTIK